MARLIGGVDEAGRGAVIGPLVIAGVAIEEDKEHLLLKNGVRDSKLLTHKKRQKLAEFIEKVARDVIVINVEPCKIDTYMKQGVNLNRIETMKFADALSYLSPEKAYVDSPDVNPERLKKILGKMIRMEMELVVEHKADNKYPACSAASIIAKVAREDAIEELKKKYGDFGPGYPSNEKTMEWLRNWMDKNKKFPDIVRKGWATSEIVQRESIQRRLGSWFGRDNKPK